ncbi:hypothetical protein HispidOSU_004797 [Sigmodon hispidus]
MVKLLVCPKPTPPKPDTDQLTPCEMVQGYADPAWASSRQLPGQEADTNELLQQPLSWYPLPDLAMSLCRDRTTEEPAL